MAMVGNAGFTTFLSRETMFMALGFERSEIMDKVIAGHAEDMKQRNDEIAKLNRVLQSVRADSAKGKGFTMNPSGPELQELQRQGVPMPKDPQKKLDGINADLKATLAGKGSKDDFKALLELVPEGNRKLFQSDFNRRGFLPPSGFPKVAHEVKFSKEEAQALIENIKTSIEQLAARHDQAARPDQQAKPDDRDDDQSDAKVPEDQRRHRRQHALAKRRKDCRSSELWHKSTRPAPWAFSAHRASPAAPTR
jgi:hypothetical protein